MSNHTKAPGKPGHGVSRRKLLKGTIAAAAAGVASSAFGAENTLQPNAAQRPLTAAPAGNLPPIMVRSTEVMESPTGIIIQNQVLAAGVRGNKAEAVRLIQAQFPQVMPNDVSLDAAGRVTIAGNVARTRWAAIKGTTAWNIICNGTCGIGGLAARPGQ